MNNKVKILYLITQSEWGGAQRYVFDLTVSMRKDFEVSVASGGESNAALFSELLKVNIPTVQIRKLIRNINPIKDISAVLEIRGILKKIRPQILHTNSSKAGVIGALASFGLKIKVVYTVHGWVFLEPMPSWKRILYIILEKISCKFRHATILLGKHEAKMAKLNKLNCGLTKIIAHGIDAPRFLEKEEARQKIQTHLQKEIPTGALWVGTIANLYETKDVTGLVNALKKIKENYISIIIGDGPLYREIEHLINKINLSDRIFLVGSMSEASSLLKAFDIFVLPSAKEGFPYVILEAMAAGLPIVATSVGAIPEMIENGKSGLLVPPRNPDILRSAILKIIKDENLRFSLGKNAEIEFSQKFSKEKMISEVQNLYNQLLHFI